MSRMVALTLVLALLVSSCQLGGDANQISGQASAQGGAVIEHASGLTVTIPPGGLYQDDVVEVRQVRPAGDAERGSYVVPEEMVYEVELEGEDAFRLAADVAIPYDPALLPEGESEAEIFPVFLFGDTWYRAEGGVVDQEANVVRVTTLHNGLWSWAVDTEANFDEEMNGFFCDASDNATVLAAAWAEYQQRQAEMMAVLAEAEVRIEEINAPTDDVVALVNNFAVGKGIGLWIKQAIGFIEAVGGGGRDGYIVAGGQRVGVLLGRVATAYNAIGIAATAAMFYHEGEALGETAGQTLRPYLAYERWKESRTLVWALENACDVDSMAPEDLEMLNDYYGALPLDERGHVMLDPLASAYPKTSSVYAIAFRDEAQLEAELPRASVIEGIGDLGTAVDQAMAAAQSNAVLDWFALTDPTLPYEERMTQARDIARRYAPYDLTCLAYREASVANFIEGATFIYRAISSSLPDDQLLRFSVGHPPSSEYYRYAPYVHEWQGWDAEYWASAEGQWPPCPEGVSTAKTTPLLGEVAIVSPADGTSVPPTEGLVGYHWSLFDVRTVGVEDSERLVWQAVPGAQMYEVLSVVLDAEGREHMVADFGTSYPNECTEGLCSRRIELTTICEQQIVIEARVGEPGTVGQAVAEGRVTVEPIHTDATRALCELCASPPPNAVCPMSELCTCPLEQGDTLSTGGQFLGAQIWAYGYIYPSAGFTERSIAHIEYPPELVTLLEGPVTEDHPDTWWEDTWWKVQYSGRTGWMNMDLTRGVDLYQDGAGLDCRAFGNTLMCVDGHVVALGMCLTEPGVDWCVANP